MSSVSIEVLEQFITDNLSNVDYNIPGGEYSVQTLGVILPGIFSQRFAFDSIEYPNPAVPVQVYLMAGEPVAWWDLESVRGFSPNP